MSPLCYLCGLAVTADRSADHVPPKQVYARAIRAAINLSNLVTLPAHSACNGAYSLDEEYFVQTLAPIADSETSRPIVADFAARVRAGEKVPLAFRMLAQFTKDLSGLVLPRGLIALRVEGARLKRVIWKIVRGLHFIETGDVLPEGTVFCVELVEPENRDPSDLDELWEAVKAQQPKGKYGAIFEYKHAHLSAETVGLHAWGMLLWNSVMIFVAYPDPSTAAQP